jgi:hypothetical protein
MRVTLIDLVIINSILELNNPYKKFLIEMMK